MKEDDPLKDGSIWRMKYLGLTLCALLILSSSCSKQESEQASSAVVINTANPAATNPQIGSNPDADAEVSKLLNQYCIQCHGDKSQKGKVRFDTLSTLAAEARSELLGKAHEALHFGDMPPEDKPQPTEEQHRQLMAWLKAQMDPSAEAKLKDKLRYPDYGNLVEHELLFGGDIKDKPYTPARRLLVSPQIFNERVIDVFDLDERERQNFVIRGFTGVTNPFLLPEHPGVRYYDHESLNGGHLLVMLTNAKWIADKQIYAALLKRPDKDQLPELSKDDKWYPRTTPAALEVIVLKDQMPTPDEMVAAINEQFARVLRREPTAQELAKYRKLLDVSIQLGGNVQGLKQMLVAVLLESEFLYRLELGGGKEDAHGRRMLTPREAAFAISYSLGDRGPDAKLMQAAEEGRLQTKQDYEREVRRLLADQDYYRGQVDPSLNGMHYQSNVTSHPKVIRFFREFFGYPGSLKVFKDIPRSDGYYRTPDRGTQGTPGWLTLEADRIVTWHVEKDQQVFETLLTSDDFFVYHNMDNEQGVALLQEWRAIYDKLKDTDWKTNIQGVLDNNLEFLKAQKSLRIVDNTKPGEFLRYMHFFDESFGRGRNPFTRPSFTHGYTYHHSPFYSLPPTPAIGRYNDWRSTKYAGDRQEPIDYWDYQPVQPFKIEHRKGILTHPAWLIAFSGNFATNPVTRGRWVREKLLAERVPDVPITVDAQVPEDPHKTFRQRLEDVTSADECWKCHKHMNPLGLPFEMYDDFGRFRTEELLEHPDNLKQKAGSNAKMADLYPALPIKTTGALLGTGDATLDGEVTDALDLIDRLAKSERVRQSIIRHAFRFYMGRNEMLSDAQTLIDADRAYVQSGGSFNEVIVSLLTSDSFMYRKEDGTTP